MENESGIYDINFDPQSDDIFERINIEEAYRTLISMDGFYGYKTQKRIMIAVINLRKLQDRRIYRKRVIDYIKN